VTSKIRVNRFGEKSGGRIYSRGALYCLLQNLVYIGKVRHRDATHAGEHEAIVPEHLWDKVQETLKSNWKMRHVGSNAKSPSLLVGLLYDPQGTRFTPFHADKKHKRYRYYVSQAKIHGLTHGANAPTRVPANDLEEIACGRIQSLLRSSEELLRAAGMQSGNAADCKSLIMAGKQLAIAWSSKSKAEQREFLRRVIGRIVIAENDLQITICRSALRSALLGKLAEANHQDRQDVVVLIVKARVKRCGREVRLIVPPGSAIGRV
jgi:site-specific DNA recombinase